MGFLDHDNYTVYKVTNTRNGKVYVGVTSKSIDQRWKSHVLSSRKNRLALGQAIKKYGETNFNIEALETCESKHQALEQEKFWIEKLNSHISANLGYNMTRGGDGVFGYKHSENAKLSMSEKRSGSQNHNFGKRWGRTSHSPDHLQMMSEKHSGRGNPMYGRKHSDESRKKISEANKLRTYKTTPVLQYSLDGNFVKRFESAQEAAQSVSGTDHKILAVCKGHRKTHKNYKWQYAAKGA